MRSTLASQFCTVFYMCACGLTANCPVLNSFGVLNNLHHIRPYIKFDYNEATTLKFSSFRVFVIGFQMWVQLFMPQVTVKR